MDFVAQCLPSDYHAIFQKIVATESGGNPYAVNVNGRAHLTRQPSSKKEAIDWSTWLIEHGYSVDMGYGQVNSQHLKRNGIASSFSVADLFDPCKNLTIAATIFGKNYQSYGSIGKALSAYNTGSPSAGFSNGYVSRVMNAKPINWDKKANQWNLNPYIQETPFDQSKAITEVRNNPFVAPAYRVVTSQISVVSGAQYIANEQKLKVDTKGTKEDKSHKKALMSEDMTVALK